MSDDKTKRGKQDRSKVAVGEKYELDHVAKKFGVPVSEVKAAQQKVGPSRQKVYDELSTKTGKKR